MHFHGLLVRVRVSRLSKGKVEGNWFRRLFSKWTCFSVVTPRKAPSENWGGGGIRKAEARESQFQCPGFPSPPLRGQRLGHKPSPVEKRLFSKQNDQVV